MKMKRKIILSLLGFCALMPLASANLAQSRKPNVLVILTDDQGWGDLRVMG
jgi:hypothetical protein